MCIIAVVPKGLSLAESVITRMWNTNRDGAGFMYAEDGKLHVMKGYMTLEAFLEAYRPHAEKGIVCHFRIKTHGALNPVNTHPFQVTEDLAFAHNGVIQGYGSAEFSDTYHFNEELVKPLHKRIKSFLKVPQIEKLITDHIGWSKLVFMNNKGVVNIINQSKGDESSEGIWFSNTGWRPPKETSYSAQNYFPRRQSELYTPETLIKEETVPEEKPLEMGDLVWLTDSHGAFKAGRIGFINWFSVGYMVAVSFEGAVNETHYMPVQKLMRCKFGMMTGRVGHLNINDYVLIKRMGSITCTVYDPDKDRTYEMSKSYVKDVTDDTDFDINKVPWLEDLWDAKDFHDTAMVEQ